MAPRRSARTLSAAIAAFALVACSTDPNAAGTSAASTGDAPASSPADPGAAGSGAAGSEASSGAAGSEAAGSEASSGAAGSESAGSSSSGAAESGSDSQWFDQAVYDRQFQQRTATFEGDPTKPYLQYIAGDMRDTTEFKTTGAKKACFANASISNPWRVTGWITMNQQLKALQEQGVISEMETRDAKDNDNTQIADIDYFISSGNCDAFIISPNSTAAMTPAVERACATGKPVIVFDRGVETDCATTYIHPIGGYAWGIDTANFLVENLQPGDKVVALRILPGVDVLENRWAAADKIFKEKGIDAVDYFTQADPSQIKKIIADELLKGDVKGVWMDAGDGAVAAIEAFEDAGVDYPVMTGEDEMSFLRKWKETGLTGLAPVYSNFQWRTPLLALQKILAGEEVPVEWVLPQQPITADQREEFLTANEGMPDGHYAKFGGEDLPGFPQVWIDRKIPS